MIFNMRWFIYLNVLALVTISTKCWAAKILGIYAMPSQSHKNFLQPLFDELANRGHELTVIGPFPLKEKRPNYTDIFVDININTLLGEVNPFDMLEMPFPIMFAFMFAMLPRLSEVTLQTPAVQDLINDKSQHFDLILSEYFGNEPVLGFSYRFNAPIIGVFTSASQESISQAVGDPYPYATIPNPIYDFSDHMTFIQRLRNTISHIYFNVGRKMFYIPRQEAMMKKFFNMSNDSPSLNQLFENTSLVLVNGNPIYSYPRAHVPNYIEAGGLHIKPPKKLPQDLKTFLDNASEGVIYFSMGSNLKSKDMPVEKKLCFLNAFSKLKQQILWKFEDDSLTDIPKNVRIEKWLPQSDLLAHPNVRVFMTHGGLLSTQEAIYHGVPLIGIPIFGDQKLNVNNAVRCGYALELDFHSVSEESVYETINEVINNKKYTENAKRISKLFHDQPQTPMERAIFWTEYIIRHKGAPHMRSAALDLYWYQYYLLDVIIVLLLGACVILVVPVLLIRALIRKLFRSSESKLQVKQSKKKN